MTLIMTNCMSVLAAALRYLFLPSWFWISLKPLGGNVLGAAAPNTPLWFRHKHRHVQESHHSSSLSLPPERWRKVNKQNKK